MTLKYTWIFFMLSAMAINAQSNIVTSGGQATNNGASITYSLGQIDYKLTTSPQNGSMSQGLQQPYEISEIVGVYDTELTSEINIYPNPVTDQIIVEIKDVETQEAGLSVSVFDIQGQLVSQHDITHQKTKIDAASWQAGIYILRTTNSSNQFRNFKIIKK